MDALSSITAATTTPADRRIEGRGTPDAQWRDWLSSPLLPHAAIPELFAGKATVWIVAPHPDDEVLGCGGLIHDLHRLGWRVRVVAVSDGGASHPGSTRWPPRALVAARRRESAAAMAILAPSAAIDRLGLPDGQLGPHEAELATWLGARLDPRDAVVTSWALDGHPDHEAVGRACRQACASRPGRPAATLYEMPVWAWHWAAPGDARWPLARTRLVALSAGAQRAKPLAIQAFASQLAPDPSTGADAILPPWAIERFTRPCEVLFA